VAVLHLHAASSHHVMIGAYSCERSGQLRRIHLLGNSVNKASTEALSFIRWHHGGV
jgi:hypothetical protein